MQEQAKSLDFSDRHYSNDLTKENTDFLGFISSVRNFFHGAHKFYSQYKIKENLYDCIWEEGNTQIIRYSNENYNKPTIVFIPSIINKSYILDLNDEDSIIHNFTVMGYEVLLVNFIEPSEGDKNLGFNELINRIQKGLLASLNNKKFISIGYCLGGLFSNAIAAKKMPNLISQVLIATPYKFSHFRKIFNLDKINNYDAIIDSFKNSNKIPGDFIKWSMSLISPYKIWNKFSEFSTMDDKAKIEKFLAIENWLNDGLSLPNKFFFDLLALIENNDFNLQQYIALNTELPSLCFYGTNDSIVPEQSCIQLYEQFENKKIIAIETGHVGLIVGNKGKEILWSQMAQWIENLSVNINYFVAYCANYR